MKVQITITGPDGTVAAHLDYDITIMGCRDTMESAIADLMDAAGIPASDDDRGMDEDTTTLPPSLFTECDARLSLLRDGMLKAEAADKPRWSAMIDKALDERLILMAESKAAKEVKP